MSSTIVRTKDFRWDFDINFSVNQNKIVKLTSEGDDVGNRWFIGEPLNVLFATDNGGVFRLADREEAEAYNRWPGDYREVDQITVDTDGDGIPDAVDGQITDDDRIIRGQLDPKWIGGFTSRFTYKNFVAFFSEKMNE